MACYCPKELEKERECGVNVEADNAVEQTSTYGVLEEMEREWSYIH
jgi:hypothetical protein